MHVVGATSNEGFRLRLQVYRTNGYPILMLIHRDARDRRASWRRVKDKRFVRRLTHLKRFKRFVWDT